MSEAVILTTRLNGPCYLCALHSWCQSFCFLFCIKALTFLRVSYGYRIVIQSTVLTLREDLAWNVTQETHSSPCASQYREGLQQREDHRNFNKWLRSYRILKSPCRLVIFFSLLEKSSCLLNHSLGSSLQAWRILGDVVNYKSTLEIYNHTNYS